MDRRARRLQAHRAAAGELGMTLETWRAWRARESVDRPWREDRLGRWLHALHIRERTARVAAGKATMVDRLELRTEAVMASFRTSINDHILRGGRPREEAAAPVRHDFVVGALGRGWNNER